MMCQTCAVEIHQARTTKKFCSNACRTAYHRGRRPPLTAIPQGPVLHHGRFQEYQERYAGLVDVIITDPPYGRKALPIYEALGQFALATLVPGGWLLCLTGWSIDDEVRRGWRQAGLEFITVCNFEMPSVFSQARIWLSTGKQTWQVHHKPVLWFQKRGTTFHRRRGGSTDRIPGPPDDTSFDQSARAWEQSLYSFQSLVRSHTNPQDVICDPCMGWGTTLEACVSQARKRVIGIEMLRERYAYSCQRIGLTVDTA